MWSTAQRYENNKGLEVGVMLEGSNQLVFYGTLLEITCVEEGGCSCLEKELEFEVD